VLSGACTAAPASIWATAAIGIMAGVGLWGPGAVAPGLAIGILSVFQYGLTLRTSRSGAYAKLARELTKVEAILEFKIEPY